MKLHHQRNSYSEPSSLTPCPCTKPSRLPIPTPRSVPVYTETASLNRPPTPLNGQNRNTRKPISPSTTRSACPTGSPRERTLYALRTRSRNACLLHASPIKPRSWTTSNQPVRSSRLLRVSKLELRDVFNSTRLWKPSVLPSRNRLHIN